MARRKMPPIAELDPNIVALVAALNSFRGITTCGSCGGHPEPRPGQWPAGEWVVSFQVAPGAYGRRAVEFLAWLVNNDAHRDGLQVHLDVFAPPPYLNIPGECVSFHLGGWGGEDPEAFAQEVRLIKRRFYQAPRPGRAAGRSGRPAAGAVQAARPRRARPGSSPPGAS
jgi:hypothetical protein